MKKIYAATFADLDLAGKTILDAATGAGQATYAWAEHIATSKLNARIISVDIDQPVEHVARLKQKLGPLHKYVHFCQADIFKLDFLANASVDVVNCHDTMVFLNPVPLKLLSALKEFHRVLKPGGQLIIVSELPGKNTADSGGQWQRWNLAKAVWALQGETWSCEPLLPEVVSALELLGFSQFKQHHFPAKRIADYQPVMKEWQEIMTEKISQLPWPSLKPALLAQVAHVMEKVSRDGYLLSPDKFLLRCMKTE